MIYGINPPRDYRAVDLRLHLSDYSATTLRAFTRLPSFEMTT